MIVDRYIAREIAKPLIAVGGILLIIFVGYSSTRHLANTASGLLTGSALASLISLRAAIALEVLLPVSLYLSVVLSLAALYTDSEITAMRACGIGQPRVLLIVFLIASVLGLLTAGLSLFGRPWAYEKIYWIEAKAEATLELSRLSPGSFFASQHDNRVFFIDEIDEETRSMERVFIRSEQGDIMRVTFAKTGRQRGDTEDGSAELVLRDGHTYEINRDGEKVLLGEFGQLIVPLEAPEPVSPGYRRKAAPTLQLAQSTDPIDVAEFQWRLSTPISTVLLALLGVLISRGNPRTSRYTKALAAVLVYAIYYNLVATARKWIQTGVVDAFPGIWWVPATLALLLILLLIQPGWGLSKIRKAGEGGRVAAAP